MPSLEPIYLLLQPLYKLLFFVCVQRAYLRDINLLTSLGRL